MALSNVKLVSDGVSPGTQVLVDGVAIEGVTRIEWVMESADHIGVLRISVEGAQADADAIRVAIDGPDVAV